MRVPSESATREFGSELLESCEHGAGSPRRPTAGPASAAQSGYGAVAKAAEARLGEAFPGSWPVALQTAFVWILGLAVVLSIGFRAAEVLASLAKGRAPAAPVALVGALAPSPAVQGSGLSRAACTEYTYPQCEAAMLAYIAKGALSRCEAFERVKAEGDMLAFPNAASEARCASAGCCGCPGQCSRCPPRLPECSSWALDGDWKVAFSDGSEVFYTFDAHGHVQAELPVTSLPVTWRATEGAFIPMGNDVAVGRYSVREAEAQCQATLACKGIVYDTSSLQSVGQQDTYHMYLKSSDELVYAPGTGWHSLLEDKRPTTVNGMVAFAGTLNPGQVLAADATQGDYVLDLHRAAPQFFPEGSTDTFSLSGGALGVRRELRGGLQALQGSGVQSAGPGRRRGLPAAPAAAR